MPRTYVQLGKFGDICNLLPLLRGEAERGEQPALLVAAEFASLLDGVSYVRPMVYEGPYHEVDKAYELARQTGNEVVCTQVNCSTENVKRFVYGPAGLDKAVTTSFQKESWRAAKRLDQWDTQAALLFDRRDAKREQTLVQYWTPGGNRKGARKHILLSIGGASSPFPYANFIRELVKAKFQDLRKYNVVDLAEVKAERFYDLLALYEQAECLIATDSAPLHLARATPVLPVLAFANDRPLLWNGSPWRPNHAFYCRYSDTPARISEFSEVLSACVNAPDQAWKSPKIVHVWNAYEGPSRRGYTGKEYTSGHWFDTPIEVGACGRDSAINLKDEKRFPYLKDCIRMGLQRAQEADLVCVTRPDTLFREGLTDTLLKNPFCFAYRMELQGTRLNYRPIADLFCAPKSWWVKKLPDIPDMIFGRDHYWPHVLWGLFHQDKAHDATGMVWRQK